MTGKRLWSPRRGLRERYGWGMGSISRITAPVFLRRAEQRRQILGKDGVCSEHAPCAPALGQVLSQCYHRQPHEICTASQRQVDFSNPVLQIREVRLQLRLGRLQALALPTVQPCYLEKKSVP